MSEHNPLRKVVEGIRDAGRRHRRRHRPTGFGFAIADSVHYLVGADWESLTGEASLFLHREYRSLLESHGPDEIQSRYALVYRGPRPVAAVACQSLDVSGWQLQADAEPTQARGLKNLRRRGFGKLRTRLLVCGNLLSWGPHGVAFARDEPVGELWPAVAEALYRIRRADRLAGQTQFVMLKDYPVPEDGNESEESLRDFSYRALETEPDMVLELPPSWSGFEDYLGGMTAKYRKAVRKILVTIYSACVVERVCDLEPHATRIHELYGQVLSRSDVRLTRLPEDYLPALARWLGPERFRCTLLRHEGEVVGFVTTLKDGHDAVGYFIGFEYSLNDELPLYLRLLHAVVEDALALGCRRISFGRTALEPKARLGCRPVHQRVWVRHRLPAVNLLVRQALQAVPHHEAPERSPFKKS